MASLATAIQYTIRSNLSVTIVAMVKTEVDSINELNRIDTIINNKTAIMKPLPQFIGCPIVNGDQINKIEPRQYKVSLIRSHLKWFINFYRKIFFFSIKGS